MDGAILWDPDASGDAYDGTFNLSFDNERQNFTSAQEETHDGHINRFWVPQSTARGAYLRLRVDPGTTLDVVWGIHGMSLSYRPTGDRVAL
jgi:hypothetical protein